ncbi:MAG: sulfatase-like hydrolase/transferase [Candidatus Paceibacterota bacterium]
MIIKPLSKRFILILILLSLIFGLLFFYAYQNRFKESSDYSCPDCNVVMIAITNVSAEHMGSYGYFRDTTPNIDKFAKDNIFFENAFSPASWTLPVAASIFTSQYPFTHGVMDRGKDKILNVDITTLAEELKNSGYNTVAFTGGGDYNAMHGLERGFEEYIDSDYFVKLNNRLPLALKWLKDNSPNKFFLFLQGFDAHCPFNPPDPYSSLFFEDEFKFSIKRNFCIRGFKSSPKEEYTAYYFQQRDLNPIDLSQDDIDYLISQYDGEIAMADNSVNEFLKELEKLGLMDKTIIIILSEHGEMFGKHGRFGRAGTNRGTLYDEVLHVPLIIKHPKIKEAKRINGLAQLIDVMPTILDFLDIPSPVQSQGKSLIPLIYEGKEVNDYVYAGAKFGQVDFEYFNLLSANEMVRDKEWKLLREVIFEESPQLTWELYNVAEDPDELNNLISQRPDVFNSLKEKLSKWSSAVLKSNKTEN